MLRRYRNSRFCYYYYYYIIFDLPVATTSVNINSCSVLNPGNVGVAVRILMMTSTQDMLSQIQMLSASHPPFLRPVKTRFEYRMVGQGQQ